MNAHQKGKKVYCPQGKKKIKSSVTLRVEGIAVTCMALYTSVMKWAGSFLDWMTRYHLVVGGGIWKNKVSDETETAVEGPLSRQSQKSRSTKN